MYADVNGKHYMFAILGEISGGSESEELSKRQSSFNIVMCVFGFIICTTSNRNVMLRTYTNPCKFEVHMTKRINFKSIHPETDEIFLYLYL